VRRMTAMAMSITLTAVTAIVPTAPRQVATNGCDERGRSCNWAGYLTTNVEVNGVQAEWKVPAVANVQAPATDSASWVGLGWGGSDADPLLQIGVEEDGNGGQANIYPWYNSVSPSHEVNDIPLCTATETNRPEQCSVEPGDVVQASIQDQGAVTRLTLVDRTRGWSRSVAVATPEILARESLGELENAEWVFERPTVNGTLPDLADAAPDFGGAAVSTPEGRWTLGTLSRLGHLLRSTMNDCSGALLAQPTPVSGSSFDTVFKNPGEVDSWGLGC
jgi:hypothetical protein